MPPLSVLVKPASSACDLKCEYCFYRDEASRRSEAFLGYMSEETAEQLIVRAFELAEKSCGFMFQGGEPTLAGLDFFKGFAALVKKHNNNNVKIYFSLQTNGLSLTSEWAKFLRDESFLVGISLDGPSEINDLNRKDALENGTFKRVLKGCELLKEYGVEYNILSVITSRSVRSPERLFNFYKKQGFKNLQFIPCIEAFDGRCDFSPSPKAYGEFLIKIFDLWFKEVKAKNYISIRHIENYLDIMSGREPENCSMRGHCGIQFVTEGNGNVYPCDFYALDEFLLGNVYESSFKEMILSEKGGAFLSSSAVLPEKCKSCEWVNICRNGCRRYRMPSVGGADTYKYCESNKMFFEKRYNELTLALHALKIRS